VFPGSPQEALNTILETGTAPAKNILEFWPTPPAVVDRMLELAEFERFVGKRLKILEPSAGDGLSGIIPQLVAELKKHTHCVWLERFDAVEFDEGREKTLRDFLRLSGTFNVDVVQADFLAWTPGHRYTHALMNPPFTAPGDSTAYITHIEHAWKMLEPNGILIAVAPAGLTFNTQKRIAEFKEFIESNGVILELPDKAFKESGTGVKTVLVKVVKP
jgi:tRNA1(Val) A37 N6-methylase TrmN6